MMTEFQLANILEFFVVAILWTVTLFIILPLARLDWFRQKMFAVRDELFDYAANGNIAFDHPAYVMLRQQMNGFIRYGHQLTVFRCLMTALAHKVMGRPKNNEWYPEWQKALSSIHEDSVRESLESFYNRGMWLAAKRLLFASPILWFVVLLFMGEVLVQGAAKGISQVARMAAGKAFTGPINDRLIEEAAQGEFA